MLAGILNLLFLGIGPERINGEVKISSPAEPNAFKVNDRGAVEKNSTSTEIGLEGRSCGRPKSVAVSVDVIAPELGLDAEYTNC